MESIWESYVESLKATIDQARTGFPVSANHSQISSMGGSLRSVSLESASAEQRSEMLGLISTGEHVATTTMGQFDIDGAPGPLYDTGNGPSSPSKHQQKNNQPSKKQDSVNQAPQPGSLTRGNNRATT